VRFFYYQPIHPCMCVRHAAVVHGYNRSWLTHIGNIYFELISLLPSMASKGEILLLPAHTSLYVRSPRCGCTWVQPVMAHPHRQYLLRTHTPPAIHCAKG